MWRRSSQFITVGKASYDLAHFLLSLKYFPVSTAKIESYVVREPFSHRALLVVEWKTCSVSKQEVILRSTGASPSARRDSRLENDSRVTRESQFLFWCVRNLHTSGNSVPQDSRIKTVAPFQMKKLYHDQHLPRFTVPLWFHREQCTGLSRTFIIYGSKE